MLHIAHAVCSNPHSSSNWDSRITIQLGYKHIFCQNVASIKKLFQAYRRDVDDILRLVVWQLFTDVSGQCIGPIFKGQESEKKRKLVSDVVPKRL
jgi:hypothetical protein